MEIPQSKYGRRAFFAFFGIICALLIIIWAIIIPLTFHKHFPSLYSIFTSLTLSIFTSLVTATLLAMLVTWLLPRPDLTRDSLHIIDARERDETIEHAREDTEFWWFTGGLGRYNRVSVLPYLAKEARRRNRTIGIVLLLLDPDDELTCTRYARLRMGLRSGRQANWTYKTVRHELLATIVAAYCWTHSEPLLKIEIGLKKACSLMRTEVSAHTVILTTEDSQAMTVKIPHDSPFYDLYREEFRLALSQSRALPESHNTFSLEDATATTIRDLLEEIGLRTIDLVDEDLKQISDIIHFPVNPYG